MKRLFGFTIVEIIVVIVAIGILATIGIVSYSGMQVRTRDTERKADAESMQSALEVFYEQYGRYPAMITGGSPGELGDIPGFYRSTLRLPNPALLAPGAAATTQSSWTWNTAPTLSTYSITAYSTLPPTNTLCQTATPPAPTCLRYVIRWQKETDNSIQEIKSKFGN